MNKKIKFLIEFAPLLVFLIAYKLYGITPAAIAVFVSSTIAVLVNYIYEKNIAYMQIITLILMGVILVFTLLTGDSKYIKMKPTFINIFFSLVLGIGVFMRKGLLKYVFDGKIVLDDDIWLALSKRFALFFLFLAMLNELVWRNFSEDIWVNFKVFGITIITTIFMAIQMRFLNINRHD